MTHVAKPRQPARASAKKKEQESSHETAPQAVTAPPPGNPNFSALNDWFEQTASDMLPSGAEAKAEQGMSGERSSMPYRPQMEAGFGQDLSRISVFQGPSAQNAADSLGAEAYAHRGGIVLGGSPSLETMAEETAHVLQSEKGGRGGLTDPAGAAEVEASTVAANVASGQAAGALSVGIGRGAVARKKRKKAGKHSRTKENTRKSKTEKDLRKNRMGSGKNQVSKSDLNRVKRTVSHKSTDLSDDNKDAHIHTQGAIYNEMWGDDGKKRPKLSKVVPGGGAMISGQYGTDVGGSIGYDQTTAGMTAVDTKKTLGLDFGRSRYLKQGDAGDKTDDHGAALNADGRPEFSDKHVTYLQWDATDEMADRDTGLTVAMSKDMADRAKSMKAGGDQQANFPAGMYPDAQSADPTTKDNAFRGTGITGTNRAEGLDGINQELSGRTEFNADGTLNQKKFEMPDGARMMHRDNDKATPDDHIATWKIDSKTQEGSWDYNPNCRPEVKITYKEEERDSYQNQLDSANDLLSKEGPTVAKNKKDVKKLEGEVKKLDQEAKALGSQAGQETDTKKASKLKNQASGKKGAATTKRKLIETLKKKIDEGEKAIDEATTKVSELTPKLTQVNTDIKQLKSDIKKQKGKKKRP